MPSNPLLSEMNVNHTYSNHTDNIASWQQGDDDDDDDETKWTQIDNGDDDDDDDDGIDGTTPLRQENKKYPEIVSTADHAKNNNNNNTKRADDDTKNNTLTAKTMNVLYNTFLSLNAFINVPMWSILIIVSAFTAFVYYTYPIKFIRYPILGYLSYCFFDTRIGSGCTYLSQYTIERLRHFSGFKYVAQYFPISLIKTVDITATNGPYIFVYIPHGIIGMGVNTAINTNACNFDSLYPGIVRWGVTLNSSFRIPLWREWIHWLGFICADKHVLVKILQQRQQSIVLVPGGSIEALYTEPNSFKLIDRRRGFIRLALETGSKLVPIIGFGENNAFKVASIPKPDTIQNRVQQFICKVTSFSTPILLSPFPQHHPVNVVVGSPIAFKHQKEITTEYIELCYLQYKNAVTKLYNDHKHRYQHEDIKVEWVL